MRHAFLFSVILLTLINGTYIEVKAQGLEDPTFTIDVPDGTQSGEFDVTITFNESVTGLERDDILLTGESAMVAELDGENAEYTATITPADDVEGSVMVQLAANAVENGGGNGNAASTVITVEVDTKVPTVEITGIPTIEKNEAFDIIITFSEEVNGFAVADLTINGPATATLLKSGADGDKVYTVTITPDPGEEGDVTITVKENAVKDLAGNDNTASIVSTVHIDTIVPTVTDITGIPTIEKNEAFDIIITFSEEVNGFAVADLTINGPATATLLKSGADGDKVYTVTITPDPGEEDDVTIKVDAGTVKDFALNDNTASSVTDAVHVDTVVPTVTGITGIPTIEKNEAFDIIITFSEEVNGFAVADLTINGPATATLLKLATRCIPLPLHPIRVRKMMSL